ncbi:MAG: NosD domain-containing protein [Thermoplasmata archaeon]
MVKMQKRTLFVLFIIFALLAIGILFVSSQTAKARTINVDDSGGKDYTKIQDAINASFNGDTVYVYNGTYNEEVTVSKSINLVGESNQNTVIRTNSEYTNKGIYVTANYVNISNIKVDNFTSGIYLDHSSNNNITSNTITNNYGGGILLYKSSNNNILSNTVTDCGKYGIDLGYITHDNIITSNTLINSSIFIEDDITSTVSNNTINGKPVLYYKDIDVRNSPQILDNVSTNEIILCNCRGFVIINTKIEYGGILLRSSSHIDIISNNITNCSYGIHLYSSSDNKILSNAISNCECGIYLWSSSNNNNIASNNIYGNKRYGLLTVGGTNNIAHNNWWGNASGPYNSITNPNGTGDNISDDVVFSPWAKTPFDLSLPYTPHTIEQPLADESAMLFMIIVSCIFISLIGLGIYVPHKYKENGGKKWRISISVFTLIVLSRLADIGTTYIFDKNLMFEQNMFVKELGFGWNFLVIRDILAVTIVSAFFLYYLAVRKDCYPQNKGYTIGKFALFLTSGKDVSFFQSFFKTPRRKNFFMTISFMLSIGTIFLGFTIGLMNFLAGVYNIHLMGREPLLKIVLMAVVYAIVALSILILVSYRGYKKLIRLGS